MTGVSQPPTANTAQANQPTTADSPTVPSPPWQVQQPTQPSPLQPPYVPPQSIPPQAYQPTVAVSPGSLPSAGPQFAAPPLRRRKNRLVRVLLILVVVLLVLVSGWFLALRPYLHGVVQSQIDGVLSNAVNQIDPAEGFLLPPGSSTVDVTEAGINNFIVLNTAPSDPVQQMHMTITPAGLRLDFQVYGFACAVTGVPQAINGQLVMTNVTVEGIASLLISPDEMTATLNAHLRDASAKIHRSISGVVLKDHEMDIQVR
jgi:hypothetical protein